MRVGELTRLDLEAIVPVAAPHGLPQVACSREGSRLPLFEYVAVLVQHE